MSKPTILVNGEPLAGPLPLFQRWGRDGVRDGTKLQTRRLGGLKDINKEPSRWSYVGRSVENTHYFRDESCGGMPHAFDNYVRCPYGQAGDIRYLREPLRRDVQHGRCVAIYSDDLDMPLPDQREVSLVRSIIERGAVIAWRWKRDNLPHQFMPREAARTFVKLTDIRCERVQDITEADAKAEGVLNLLSCERPGKADGYRDSFAVVWEDIHGEGAWADNAWVWCLSWTLLDSPTVEVQHAD